MSKQLSDKELSRAWEAASKAESPAALDEKILGYAQDQAPAKKSSGLWMMPAAAAACVALIAVVFIVPKAPPDATLTPSSPNAFDKRDALNKRDAFDAQEMALEETAVTAPAAGIEAGLVADARAGDTQQPLRQESFSQAESTAASAEERSMSAPVRGRLAPPPMPQASEVAGIGGAMAGGSPVSDAAQAQIISTGLYDYLERVVALQNSDDALENWAQDRSAKARVAEAEMAADAAASTTPPPTQPSRSTAVPAAKELALELDQQVAALQNRRANEYRYLELREACDCDMPATEAEAIALFTQGLLIREPMPAIEPPPPPPPLPSDR